MGTQTDVIDRAGGCFESVRGGCVLGVANAFMLAMIALVAYFLWSSVILATRGEVTTGRVLALESSSSEGSIAYSPIFEFTVDGQRYEVNSGIASDPPEYSAGDDVRVRYNPDNPQHAEVDSPWNSPLIYGGAVAVMAIAMIAMNVVGMRRIWRGESIDD